MIALISCLLLFVVPASWVGNNALLPNVIGQTSPSVEMTETASSSQQRVLERLFTTSEVSADWFIPSFLEQIPVAQIQDVLTDISTQLGAFQNVQETADGFAIRFSRGTVPAQIRLEEDGRIAGLFFEPASIPIDLDEAIAVIESSPYETSVLVTQDDETLVDLNADQALAVGSAFKLSVLAALNQQINSGLLTWDTVVELQPDLKSLPSGLMQDWPDGSFVTVDTLAKLMIALSDNTATDVLIQSVGREAVEAMAERNQPLLTTRELFTLKNPENARLLRQYRDGDREARRKLLEDLGDRPLPSVNTFTGSPIALDVEWFFSPRELCTLMDSVANLPAMQINPGVANPINWKNIAFKGGSEPGVLNMTTRLVNEEGNTYCISATWNSTEQALNEDILTQLYRSMIAGLTE
ncbi:MAG: serine hydrolase [Cyanobacteria bacterium J06626_14]